MGTTLTRPRDVVRWLVAVQAQEYPAAKWAVGQRLRRATDLHIERAFAKGDIVRTHVLRPTWHFVAATDIRWVLELTAPHVHAVNASIYRKLGLDRSTFRRSAKALTQALRGGHHLTRQELNTVLQRAGIRADDTLRLAYLVMHAELEGVICSGPRRGKQFTYALLDERVPSTRPRSRDDALAELTYRYYRSRGPATVQDFANWSGLPMADARRGLEATSQRLEREVVDGSTYWFVPPRTAGRRAPKPIAHFLSVYDEYVSAYKDRSAMAGPGTGARLRAMGNALNAIVTVDGRIVGVWKSRVAPSASSLQPRILTRLTSAERQALEVAQQKYARFLGGRPLT